MSGGVAAIYSLSLPVTQSSVTKSEIPVKTARMAQLFKQVMSLGCLDRIQSFIALPTSYAAVVVLVGEGGKKDYVEKKITILHEMQPSVKACWTGSVTTGPVTEHTHSYQTMLRIAPSIPVLTYRYELIKRWLLDTKRIFQQYSDLGQLTCASRFFRKVTCRLYDSPEITRIAIRQSCAEIFNTEVSFTILEKICKKAIDDRDVLFLKKMFMYIGNDQMDSLLSKQITLIHIFTGLRFTKNTNDEKCVTDASIMGKADLEICELIFNEIEQRSCRVEFFLIPRQRGACSILFYLLDDLHAKVECEWLIRRLHQAYMKGAITEDGLKQLFTQNNGIDSTLLTCADRNDAPEISDLIEELFPDIHHDLLRVTPVRELSSPFHEDRKLNLEDAWLNDAEAPPLLSSPNTNS